MCMDPPETKEEEGEEEEEEEEKKRMKKGLLYILFRCLLGIFFSSLATLLLSFLVLLLAVFLGNLSIWNPISVPSQCKIVASSVDLRSSKVCELGLLNYKAKHVFYPFDKKKFRCHYDYYWASVFKVEYVDHSGHQKLAFAEAPNEALPSNCRPNFGSAWLTKDKFKVNETYDCWYTMGISKVNIYQDGLFNCQAKDPSTFEMLRRYLFLSMEMLNSLLSNGPSFINWRWDAVAGAMTGFSSSLLSFGLVAVLHQFKSFIRQTFRRRVCAQSPNLVQYKRIFLLIAYFSFMGWLGVQYLKRLGLSDILGVNYI